MRIAVDFAAESLACWESVSQVQHRDWENDSPALQSYLARASLLTLVIELYKVLETRTDTHNFYQLVEYAHQEGIISDPDTWRDIIENTLKPTWAKIKSLRHKFYAHLDDKKSPKQLILEANFVPNDFRVLLDDYDSFLRKMAQCLRQKPTPISVKEDSIRAELKTILEALKARHGSP